MISNCEHMLLHIKPRCDAIHVLQVTKQRETTLYCYSRIDCLIPYLVIKGWVNKIIIDFTI